MSANKSVLVAMSGGVDSSVTAFLLKQEGYTVTGVTFNLYEQKEPQHVLDAQKAAEILGISHVVMHLEDIFEEKIINYFVASYMKGETPNPCSFCNKYIKFAALESKADELGIQYLATGHYSELLDVEGNKRLTVSKDEKKSQEYFLALVPQKTLNRIIFPLHELQKPTVREIARQNNLEFFGDKPDSQEVCFLQNKTYIDFLNKKIDTSPYKNGEIIISKTGKSIGKHTGFFNYTIGQRRGIGVGVGKPQYVVNIDPVENKISIGDKELVEKKHITVNIINTFEPLVKGNNYLIKIRYKSKSQVCEIIKQSDSHFIIKAQEYFFAPSNGQIAVLYTSNNLVIAAGEIIKSF